MSEHIVKAFAEQLEGLANAVAQMGGLAESQFASSIEAIAKRDTALAESVIAADERLDALQTKVEEQAIRVLALRQPIASDLRATMASIRIAYELERVGDLAKNVGKRAMILNREPPIRLTQGLARMGRQALAQLKQVLDAYSAKDAAAAESVWMHDEEIDGLYNSLFRELLTYMMEDPRTIGHCAHLLFVAKNIERVGDHATNIAETVYYLASGTNLNTLRPKADMTSSTPVKFEPPSDLH